MDREEAKEYIKSVREFYATMEKFAQTKDEAKFGEALDMAIEALQAKTDGDLISRKEALEQIAQAECGLHYEDCKADNCTCDYIWRICNIPSAEPKTGEWIMQNEELKISDYRCSVCGYYQDDVSNYCPNCGADMRGDTE